MDDVPRKHITTKVAVEKHLPGGIPFGSQFNPEHGGRVERVKCESAALQSAAPTGTSRKEGQIDFAAVTSHSAPADFPEHMAC